jgi:hypothetical protein
VDRGQSGRITRRLNDEGGFALVLALGLMIVLGIAAATGVAYSTTNYGQVTRSRADQKAFALAEAGVNNAVSVLSSQSVNALDPRAFCSSPTQPLPCSRTLTYEDGTVTWTGSLDAPRAVWHLTATGYMRNPTGPKVERVKQVLNVDVPVKASNTGPLNNMAWNYIYATKTGDPDGCDETLQNVANMGSPMYVDGNLCLNTPSNITGGPLVVRGTATIDVNSAIGSSAAPINEAHIGYGCRFKNQEVHTPCSSADKVWANVTDTAIPSINAPVADFPNWYLQASPGPRFPCDPSSSSDPSTWPTFDNDGIRNNSLGVWNLTPATSYSCWTGLGEIRWDAAAKLLTVRGTIYIDGSAKIDNGAVNAYNGQSTLYLSGTFFMGNSKLCAGLSADKTDCDFANWNPNTELFVIVADGNGGQVPTGVGAQLKSSRFQGGIYATNAIEFDTTSQIEGPMVGTEVIMGQSIKTYTFPFITTVPAGIPGNPIVYAQPQPPQNWGP